MLKSISLLFLLFSLKANAFQIKTAEEGVLLDFDISAFDLTHIHLENDRIIGIKSAVDRLIVDRDEEQGHLFVRPNGTLEPIQAFILAESGKTINVRLTPQDIPLETIKIKPYEAALEPSGNTNDQDMILSLIQRLYDETDLEREALKAIEPLSILGMPLEPMAYLQEGEWKAYHYLLENTSRQSLELLESDFKVDNVEAIAIENKSLQPGGITSLYLVKRL